ncbi:MAG: diguanylate cyclase [Gallionellaceae bacterium]|nr:MAG: diguanylate cyclase [Gallionellaceae bacterium]
MNSNQIIELLQESPLFQKVKSSTLSSLLTNTTLVRLAAGQILLTPGQHNDRIYIVLSGRLRAQLNADDADPLALFGIGECVGELSMFDDSQVSAYVVAVTDCQLLAIEHVEAWSVLNRSLQASHNLLAMMANRIRSSNRTLAQWAEQAQSFGALNYVNNITGLYNRHWLAENIGRLILRQTKNHQPIAFVPACTKSGLASLATNRRNAPLPKAYCTVYARMTWQCRSRQTSSPSSCRRRKWKAPA